MVTVFGMCADSFKVLAVRSWCDDLHPVGGQGVIPEVVMDLRSTRGRVKIGGCARDDAGRSVVPGEPVLKSGRGGCSAPWTVALEHGEQIRLALAAALRAHACCGVRQGGAGCGG
jgi:hypothetical protein